MGHSSSPQAIQAEMEQLLRERQECHKTLLSMRARARTTINSFCRQQIRIHANAATSRLVQTQRRIKDCTTMLAHATERFLKEQRRAHDAAERRDAELRSQRAAARYQQYHQQIAAREEYVRQQGPPPAIPLTHEDYRRRQQRPQTAAREGFVRQQGPPPAVPLCYADFRRPPPAVPRMQPRPAPQNAWPTHRMYESLPLASCVVTSATPAPENDWRQHGAARHCSTPRLRTGPTPVNGHRRSTVTSDVASVPIGQCPYITLQTRFRDHAYYSPGYIADLAAAHVKSEPDYYN